MTQEKLQDAFDFIDDDMIAATSQLRQQREESELHLSRFRKQIYRREFIKWGSLAASLCLLIGISFRFRMGASTSDSAAELQDPLYSKQEDINAAESDNKSSSANDSAAATYPEIQVEAETLQPETSQETVPASTDLTPPSLQVLCGSTSVMANQTTYEWSQEGIGDVTNYVIACGMHPLECEDTLVRIHTTQTTAQLQFLSAPGEPTEITVQCWSETCWGNISAVGETVSVNDGQIRLKQGGHIYEVTARWKNGTVHYAFYIYYE